jgi:S1-C subfamily serine protease
MALQFRKRVKLAKGMYFNLSQSGVSMSLGTKGAQMTIGNRGITESVGIPWHRDILSKRQSWKATNPKNSSDTKALPDEDTDAQGLEAARASGKKGHRVPTMAQLIGMLGAILLFSTYSIFGKTTAQIVGIAKPAVVTIIQTNTSGVALADGTGWFCNVNTIVTNAHVLKGTYNALRVVNVANGYEYTVDHINLVDQVADIAVMTVKETCVNFLPLADHNPVEGEDIVVIGNPVGHYGTVTTGIVSAIRSKLMQVSAPVSPGSSGSPVMNSEAEVVGMIWGGDKEVQAHDLNYAVPLSDLKSDVVMADGQNIGDPLSQANSPEVTTTVAGLHKPTRFGKTTTNPDGISFTEVLGDDEAMLAISAPLVSYLIDSCDDNHRDKLATYFMEKIQLYFEMKNITTKDMIANETAYANKYPRRTYALDYQNIKIVRIDQYKDTYIVSVPFQWQLSNSNKTRSGSSITAAIIKKGHYSNDEPSYFITGIWHVKSN